MASKGFDLSGQRFGNLRVEDRTNERGHGGGVIWNCTCDCGNKCKKLAGDLRSGHVKSCGCANVEQRRKRPYEALYNNFINVGVKRKGRVLSNTLTYEEFLEFIQNGHCFYCGDKVEWAEYNIVRNKASYKLDRKDSSLGYTKENCVVCCPMCNQMKLKLSCIDFIRQVRKIAEHF